ncbi:hypothetical protein DSECCO2_303390 [anaerobic digester metagenome]
MYVKKTAVIICVSAAMICGAIRLSMRLTEARELEMEVSKPQQEIAAQEQTNIYNEGGNIPLYYDEEDVLLLPIRNVAQGLGGTVTWDKTTKNVVLMYKGKKLLLEAGNSSAQMCGYHIKLHTPPQSINGCLYGEASILSDFFSTEVRWDSAKKQISLKSKEGLIPIIESDFLIGKSQGKEYNLEIPVIMGLNDGSYEKGLNKEIMQEIQGLADEFMLDEGDGNFHLQLEKGLVNGEFISLYWRGEKGEQSIYKTINIDLREQKTKLLTDMLTEKGIENLKEQVPFTENQLFYITEEKELALIETENEEPTVVVLPGNGDVLKGQWQTKYADFIFG